PDLRDTQDSLKSLDLLQATVERGFSPTFGGRLRQLPIFLLNLGYDLAELWSRIDRFVVRFEQCGVGWDEEQYQSATTRVGMGIRTLLHYPALADTVLFPYLRRSGPVAVDAFSYTKDPEATMKLADLLEQHREVLS